MEEKATEAESSKSASSTKEADVAHQSVAKSLFLGQIVENLVFPFPKIEEEESETLQMVVDSVSKFLKSHADDFAKYDEQAFQPEEYIQELRELGLFGLIIPEEYGGIGLSNSAYSRVIQESSKHDASTSLTVGAHSSIGMKALLLFGTDEQKKKYLPPLASGEMIASFCLTEAGSGSDAASIKTKAVKQKDGTWVLNGEKIWITNGAFADFFTVFARTDSENGKISAFIVEKAYEGVSSGPKEDKLGIRSSATTTISFENVKLPADSLLGEEGKGFKVSMAVLNNGRTGLGGGCVGGIKTCISRASAQALDRKQFDQPIASFGLIKEKIAQMTVDCFAAESIVSLVGHLIDSGSEDYSIEAAISKVYCSEAMWSAAMEALQVAGGNGYMKEYPYERTLRDCRINMIFEGTNEILRLYIALSGMKDAGNYLKDVSKSVGKIFNDPIKGFGVLSSYATNRFSQLTSIGGDKISLVDDLLADEAAIYERATLGLARASEMLLKRHGKAIIDKQFAMKRVADVAIDITVGLSTLSRVTSLIAEKGAKASEQEISIVKIFAKQANRRIAQNLRRVEKGNEDEALKELADFIYEQGGYPWDTI
ncbi:UNVERIFIED_CONTAM: hypothetical protein GTU68_057124 [Idotea baltica]|nr:hypothetical protein [Idotea baltica]